MIQPTGPFQCSICRTNGRIFHKAQITHLDDNGGEATLTVYACPSCYEEMMAVMDTFQETGRRRP